jgi:hypothetical protein
LAWLVSMIWKTSAFEFAPPYAPHVIAAVITGATLARVLERCVFAIGLAVGARPSWRVRSRRSSRPTG